ncbi:hypothetical protein B566_EDAN004271 [Ephemera danica]|nr:hypothetical protein B566_EDAN004271 [Ephemera danica]
MLPSRDWIQLKVLETTPALTQLGETLQDALELQRAHDEVLVQRQSKQSPVEDLLRQVDQRISTDDPKADVYAAMADSLGMAWRDVNKLLEERKALLDLNVQYHRASHDTSYPSDAETAKKLLTKLHDLKRAMLEAFMAALQEGRALLEKLQGLENIGTLDSRPGQTRAEAQRAISQVQHWLEALHDRRRALDAAWARRKAELEQALALAMLAAELASLDATLRVRHEALARSDQLGDSASSAELLLHEHNKLLPEAKDLQEKGLRVTRATDRLVSDENQPESVTSEPRKAQIAMQAYDVLSSCSEYLHLIDQRTDLLTQTIAFFRIAQAALTKLDQLEVQVATSEVPAAQIHAQGIRRVVEELENRKIALAERCAARKQESLLVTQALTAFLERYNELYSWLVGIGEAFVQGHQDMGSVLAMAQDFLELHKKLMHDLKLKISELESLEASLPSLVVHLQPDQRSDVEGKMANLRAQWERLRILLEYRLELSERYLRFHSLAVKLAAQYDVAEETMRSTPGGGRDSPSSRAPQEEQWLTCQQQLMQLNNVGENFLQDTAKETAASPLDRRDPHLDLKRARLCIETLLEHFNARQAALGDSWNLWQTRVTTFRETTVQWTRITMESTRTVEWVSRLDAQFYPLLDKNETSPRGLLNSLEEQQSRVLPEARRAQAEVELRLRSVEALQIEKTTGNLQNQYRGTVLPVEPIAVERLLKEHEASRHAVAELFRFTQTEAEQVATRVRQQEPPAAAQNDEDVIRRTLRDRQASWERSWEDRKTQLEQHLQKCQFDADLHQLNQQLGDLATQLGRVKGQFGESLATSRANAQAFINFERTIELLERRVTIFVSTAEKLLADEHMNSSHVQQELERLQARWAALRSQVAESRRLIDLSVQYFTLVEEAEEWFREGSRLLVTIARKSTGVKSPEEATRLLGEVETFLRPGEARQNDRIAKISFLASQLYGEERSRQVTTVLTENHEMLESFSIINIELTTLARNLKTADEERQRQQREMLEADASLAAARAEAEAAKAAAAAAEEVRRAAESAAKALKESAILIQQAPPPVQEVPPPAPVIPVIEPQPPLKKVKHEEIAPILVVPVFVEALRDATIQEGDKFTFECRVAGFPRPEVEWFKDGISIQNNPDYQTSYINGVCQLQIEETFSEDSAKFTCKAINDAGKAETHATLTCTVHGYPLPTVQWFKDGTCIDASPDYTITFNNGECRLQLDEVFLEDQATFCCQASNRLGTCHTEAKLTVKPLVPSQAPAFTVPLTNIMARTGEKIKLECEVTGSPEPRITWTHDGKAVKETREVKIINEKLKSTLSISEAFPKDAGVYTAKAKNLVGGATSSCNVSVKGRLPTETSDSEMASDIEPVKPVIQMQLKDTRVEEGSPVKLDCIITGQPEPEVIWYHDGRPVKESKEVQLLFKGDRCTLVIKEALVEESGEYRVVAVNSAGEASSTCQLIVDANVPTPEPEFIGVAPKFTKLLSDVLVPEGETTKFECVAEGDPAPKITWLLNNNPVPPSERLEMKHDENSGKVSLIITNTNTIDKGVYTAKASNSLGDAKCFATLIVRSHQETPELQRKEKQEAPYFTETLIDRTVIDGDTVRFECIVKWLYNDNPVSGREFLVSTSGQRQVLTMPDVSLDRSGIVACVAENEAGKAVCQASLRVQGVPPPSELMMDVDTTEEHTESFSMRRAVFMQSSSSSTTIQGGPEGMERHSFTQQSQQAMQQLGNQPPTQRTEAVHQVNQERPVVHQQSSLVVSRASPVTVPVPPIKPALKQRKSVPPRFISPLNGRIVDQGSDVLLEGIVDGFPIPTVTWMKNGQEVPSSCETTFEHGKTTLQLHDVNVNDAGRYTCRAENEAGTASSTADLVVKKTVFPPVFGRRLQAQVVRIGDRARLEVEVTGTPEPEITWRKDNLPITCVPGVAVKAQGQCHSLVIEKATPVHTGQYSVSATNCGGQAQSIADFAVIEAAPGITLEVTRMVFEDVDEKKNGIASKLPPTKTEPSLPDTPVSKEISTTIREESFSNTKKEISTKMENITEQSVDLPRETEKHLKREENGDVTKLKDMSEFLARIKVVPPKETIIPIELEKQSEELQKKKSEVLMDMQQKHIPKSMPQMENTTVKESKEIHSSSITTRIEKKYLSHNLNFDDIHLEPGPAPEICFSSLPEGTKLKENLAEKVKKFEEEMNSMIPMDAPAGAVRILPARQESVKINTDGQDTLLPDGITEYLIPTVQAKEKEKAVHFSENSATQNKTDERKQIVEEVFVATSAPKTGSDHTIRPSTPQTAATSEIRTPNLQGYAMEKLWTPVRPASPVERVASPKTLVIERSASPRISAEARAMEKLWTPLRPTTPIDLRPQSPKPKIEPPWIDRSASPRPNPEGIAMEKLWATKRSDHITTIITKEEPVIEPAAPAKPSVPPVEERAMSPKPSGQGIAMEKNWAHSLNPNLKKKWPPPNVKDTTVKPTLPWRKEGSFDEVQSETSPPQVDINANNTMDFSESTSQTTVTRQVQSETTHQKTTQVIASPVPVMQSIKPEQQEVQKSEAPVPPPKQEVKIIASPRPVAPKPVTAHEPPVKPQLAATPPLAVTPQPVAQQHTESKKYYIAETEVKHKENPIIDTTVVTNDLRTEFQTKSLFSSVTTKEETLVDRGPSPSVVEERGLKPSEAKKLWAQKAMEPPPPLKPVRQISRKLEQFKPVVDNVPTVDNSLEILGIVPGPPPELGFVEATETSVTERRQSKVSDIEVELEKEPKKHIVGAVRTIPPPPKTKPTVPKQPHTSASKQIPSNITQRPYTPLGLDKLLEPFPELEPFPFKPDPEKPKPNKLPPPPKPSRFVKGEFAESDYESDFDSVRIPVKWRPYESDTEELSYRKVKPPALGSHSPRPKSTEPVALPPTVFDNPPKFEGPPRPVLLDTIANQNQSSMSQQTSSSRQTTTRTSTQVTRMTTVEQRSSSTTVTGSPPGVKHGEIIDKKSPPVHKKSESPKSIVTTISNKMIGELAAESGYMADTDEPRRHQKKIVAGMQDSKLSSPSSHPATPISEAQKQCVSEKKQAAIVPPTHHKVHHHASHKPHKKPIPSLPTTAAKPTACTTQVKEPPATNFVVEDGKIKPEDKPLEPFPYQPSPPSQPRVRLPPPPSPSKFKKGEFRESDYESDYESQRIIPLWRPSVASDTEDTLQYRPIHPPSTPILIQRAHDLESETPLPPTQFEEPPPLSEGPLRPKFEPIEKLTTHKFRIDTFQEMQNQVVKPMALLGNAVDGIKPGSPPKVSYVEPPHEGSFSQYHNGTDFIRPKETSPPKVQQNISSNQFPKATQMETSKKVHMSESTEYSRRFVSMEHTTRVIQFGEKENVVETPLEPFPFKPDPEVAKIPVRVAPPPTPTKFIRGEFRESDYESDIDTVKIKPKWTPYDSDSEEPRYRKVQPPAVPPKSTITPGRVPTPPTVFDTPPSAELEHQRLQRLDQMRRRFKEERDGQQAVQAPVLPAKAAQVATQQMSEMTQAFKSKAQQFMTDITTNQKPAAVKPPSEAPALDGSDPSAYREESRHSEFGSKQIDPDTGLIYFKYDFGYEFGLILPGEGKPTTLKGGGKPVYDRDEDAIEFPIIHERSKPKRVKWESESELSEVEMANQRPGRSIIPPIQRWEPSPSPTSSPSPSPWGAGRGQRPGQGRGGSQTPPSTPSTPGSTQSSQQFALSQLRKPPSFITPLKDIAATSGSTARFECIVQAEPPPNILWSKDGRIIENCPDRQMQYRNGVCRLTIPQAFPEDSGSYTCTATNAVGSACSTATLLVPGERRGRRP